jgi:hypothetical protein
MSIPCKGHHAAPCRRVSMAQHDLGVLAAVRSSQSLARSAARLLPVTGLAILRSCATSRSNRNAYQTRRLSMLFQRRSTVRCQARAFEASPTSLVLEPKLGR